jgi:hypothetical protein
MLKVTSRKKYLMPATRSNVFAGPGLGLVVDSNRGVRIYFVHRSISSGASLGWGKL